MLNDSMDSQILTQEQLTIELLAREMHTAIAKVQEIFVTEYANLAANARIKSFLFLLTSNRVRIILGELNTRNDCAKKPARDLRSPGISKTPLEA